MDTILSNFRTLPSTLLPKECGRSRPGKAARSVGKCFPNSKRSGGEVVPLALSETG